MSLPTAWVEKIFDRLTVRYGRDFLGRWEGIPIADVKTDWASCLSGLFQHPSSIAWALDNLPDSKPPTVQEFRALCRKAPAPDVPRLEPPVAEAAVIAAEIAKLAPVLTGKRHDFKAWAYALQARDKAGEKLNMTVRTMYRQALGIEA